MQEHKIVVKRVLQCPIFSLSPATYVGEHSRGRWIEGDTGRHTIPDSWSKLTVIISFAKNVERQLSDESPCILVAQRLILWAS